MESIIKNILTAAMIIAAVYVSIKYYEEIKRSQEFERRCAIACSPSVSITPIINGADSCLCDEGHGVWRRVKNVG